MSKSAIVYVYEDVLYNHGGEAFQVLCFLNYEGNLQELKKELKLRATDSFQLHYLDRAYGFSEPFRNIESFIRYIPDSLTFEPKNIANNPDFDNPEDTHISYLKALTDDLPIVTLEDYLKKKMVNL